VIGALGGDDEPAGDAGFHGVGGLADSDQGDDGFFPAFAFGFGLARREGAADIPVSWMKVCSMKV